MLDWLLHGTIPVGDTVNLEADVLAKHVERLLESRLQKEQHDDA